MIFSLLALHLSFLSSQIEICRRRTISQDGNAGAADPAHRSPANLDKWPKAIRACQPPSSFKAGFPSDYTVGEVSDKFKQDYRVWIVREDEGFYALFAKC